MLLFHSAGPWRCSVGKSFGIGLLSKFEWSIRQGFSEHFEHLLRRSRCPSCRFGDALLRFLHFVVPAAIEHDRRQMWAQMPLESRHDLSQFPKWVAAVGVLILAEMVNGH